MTNMISKEELVRRINMNQTCMDINCYQCKLILGISCPEEGYRAVLALTSSIEKGYILEEVI